MLLLFRSLSLAASQTALQTSRGDRIDSCARSSSLTVLGEHYTSDDYTNLPPSIRERLSSSPQLPYSASHPLALLRREIEGHLCHHTAISAPSPVVTSALNFDTLGFPLDHPGRSPTDTYYINRNICLRTHTSAHEVEVFSQGHDHWLLTADVYRRDEIDASHYPIFHQMEGASIWHQDDFLPGGRVEMECQDMEAHLRDAKIEIEDEVDITEAGGWQAGHASSQERLVAAQLSARHLKATLNGLVLRLFGPRHAADAAAAALAGGASTDQAANRAAHAEPLKVRWIAASFPFTSPSFEVEVWFRGKWLEILGSGVVMEKTLKDSGVSHRIGWAFGLGLERIAMVLYSIPDIRLFWSKDPRFLNQFAMDGSKSRGPTASDNVPPSETGVSAAGGLVTFKPYSKYPPVLKDVSFWLASHEPHDNDVYEIVRDVAKDLVESVELTDKFEHPKTKRKSCCYRITYRSMDRSLEHEVINALHKAIGKRLTEDMGVELR
ncbi:phenylalanyl-trna synthetase [Ceraceosorus bombacis]|uniref:Phenylalanine--tRNA ligase, mitochondrial n=1 Tax=Ceraceosorus bombacis TaxID=401625 RepID=A0A0P1BM38_9BASI|nr:phenylalanyl-trna synthetase [Ceraceosorus bombacis]